MVPQGLTGWGLFLATLKGNLPALCLTEVFIQHSHLLDSFAECVLQLGQILCGQGNR